MPRAAQGTKHPRGHRQLTGGGGLGRGVGMGGCATAWPDAGHRPQTAAASLRDRVCLLHFLLCLQLRKGSQLASPFTENRDKNELPAYESPILIKINHAPIF